VKEHNPAVELLDCLLRNDNMARFKKIVVRQESFPDLLQQSRTRYRNGKSGSPTAQAPR